MSVLTNFKYTPYSSTTIQLQNFLPSQKALCTHEKLSSHFPLSSPWQLHYTYCFYDFDYFIQVELFHMCPFVSGFT